MTENNLSYGKQRIYTASIVLTFIETSSQKIIMTTVSNYFGCAEQEKTLNAWTSRLVFAAVSNYQNRGSKLVSNIKDVEANLRVKANELTIASFTVTDDVELNITLKKNFDSEPIQNSFKSREDN